MVQSLAPPASHPGWEESFRGEARVGGGLPGSRARVGEARAEPPMTTLCVLSRGIGGKDPTTTPVARAQGRPGPRSHSPAATAEGPGALEFPPASARAGAPPAGHTDRAGRGLGISGTSPHGPPRSRLRPCYLPHWAISGVPEAAGGSHARSLRSPARPHLRVPKVPLPRGPRRPAHSHLRGDQRVMSQRLSSRSRLPSGHAPVSGRLQAATNVFLLKKDAPTSIS